MPPVGAAIAAVAGAIGTAVSGASAFVAGLGAIGKAVLSIGLSIGAQLLSGALAKKPQSNGLQLNLKTGGNIPRTAVFGRTATEGHLIYWNLYGNKNMFLQLVYQLSDGGECDGLEKIWIDGEEINLGAETSMGRPIDIYYDAKKGRYFGWVRFFNGADNQAADNELVTRANPVGRWTANHRGRGCCYVSITLGFNEKLFTSIPQFRFQLRGLKLYDWRKDSTNGGAGAHRWGNKATYEWSENPAVILYNYQRGLYVSDQYVMGEAAAPVDLDHAFYTAAANACDEAVALKAGGTEPRYRFGGSISDEADHASNMTPILQAMAGDLLERVGEFAPIAGVSQATVMTITDADLVTGEPWTFSGSLTRSELVNAVAGQFADPTQMWELASFPMRTSSAAEIEDGNQRYGTDLTLGGVSSGTQAQRISEIVRRQARLQRTEEIVVGVKFRPLDAGDWIVRQSAKYGTWIAKITGRSMSPDGKISLSLREIDSSVFAWNPANDELDGTTPADLPSTGGLIETVAGLAVSVVEIEAANNVKRPGLRITWEPPDDATLTDVVIETRIQSDTRAVTNRFQDVEAGEGLVLDGVQSGVVYEARATIITQPARATDWTAWVSSAAATGTQVVPEATLADHANTADVAAGVEAGSVPWEGLNDDVKAVFADLQEQIDDVDAGTTADFELIRKGLSNDPAVRAEASLAGLHVQAFDDLTRLAYQVADLQATAQLNDGDQTEARILLREQMGVRVDEAVAMIVAEREVRATADEALARDVVTLVAEVGNNTTLINQESVARADGDTALGSRIDTMQTQVDGKASASAVDNLTTRVSTAEDNITAQATQISNLTTSVGDNTASIGIVSSSVDGIKIQHGVIGTINGVTGGFVLTGIRRMDGSVAYEVEINGGLLVNGTITAPKLLVSILSAITANVGTLTAGLITGNTSTDLQLDLNAVQLRVYD